MNGCNRYARRKHVIITYIKEVLQWLYFSFYSTNKKSSPKFIVTTSASTHDLHQPPAAADFLQLCHSNLRKDNRLFSSVIYHNISLYSYAFWLNLYYENAINTQKERFHSLKKWNLFLETKNNDILQPSSKLADPVAFYSYHVCFFKCL